MPQLFFTDLAALKMPAVVDGVVDQLTTAEIAAMESFGLVEGMPFILGEDGSYDHDLNRFFRAAPTMGVRSLNSLRAYARDIVVAALPRGAARWKIFMGGGSRGHRSLP
jgi:hypothetical protein